VIVDGERTLRLSLPSANARLIHITADRAMGFGLRAADGRQSLRWAPAGRANCRPNAGPA
jgi:hypothetical protein